MKKKESFGEEFQAALQELEAVRLVMNRKRVLAIILGIMSIVLLLIGTLDLDHAYFSVRLSLTFCLVGIISSTFFFFYAQKTIQKYKDYYKKNIIKVFVKKIKPNVKYEPKWDRLSLSQRRSKLTTTENMWGEDYFKGKTSTGYSFQFSELYNKIEQDNINAAEKHLQRRLFYEITNPKVHFEEVLVLPKKTEKGLGEKIIDKFRIKEEDSCSKVYDIHPGFDQDYIIQSKNPSEIDVLLDYDLLESICEINRSLHQKMQFSFVGHKVYLDLPINKDFLDSHLKDSVLENNFAKEFYNDLDLSFGVLEKISQQIDLLNQDKERIKLKDKNLDKQDKNLNWLDDAYDHFLSSDD